MWAGIAGSCANSFERGRGGGLRGDPPAYGLDVAEAGGGMLVRQIGASAKELFAQCARAICGGIGSALCSSGTR